MFRTIQTHTALAIVISFGLFISIASGYFLYEMEENKIKGEFNKEINSHIASLHKEIIINFEALRSLAILFSDSTTPEWLHFSFQAQRILSRHKNIQALEWIPLVLHSERTAYELKPLLNLPKFEIIQRKIQGSMVKAPIKDVYFPVYFIEPYIGNELAYGFDLSSNATRHQAIIAARDSGQPTATGSITLVQEKGNQKGFLAFIPIYKFRGISTEEKRRKHLQGLVLGVFRIGDIFNSSLKGKELNDIQITLLDTTQPLKTTVLHQTSIHGKELNEEVIFRKSLPLIWGRQWSIVASPSKDFFNNRRNVLPLAVFISFILFTVYIALYIHYISKRAAIVQKTVEEKNQEINEANKKLELLSRSDGLTGIANRRCMDDFFDREWRLAIRNKSSLSFVIIDIDFFKLYNDNYGHPQGDDCLKKVAKQLESTLKRPGDLIARYGGEEFSLILPNTKSALKIAENCRKAIESLNIAHEHSSVAKVVTISIGICSVIPTVNMSSRKLIETADKALYLAKDKGRNNVEELQLTPRI
ncbi:MAG: diguanylate cyclase [Colwellia sp.]|nr:diguanylate cyclase [Colwellia sp.]